jgi:hypothetical protein
VYDDAVDPRARFSSAEFRFDVTLERLARGFAAGIAIVDVEGGFDGWPVGLQEAP